MKIYDLIKKSIYKDNEPSSSRIFAYTMQLIILLFGITAIAIELTNAIIQWNKGQIHIIPWEHITIIGMWLAHQLTLLGIYKKNETTISKVGDKINIKTDVKESE
jgi:hypothetical protein